MEGTIGEVRMFASNFAPKNWSYCNGAILNIASNTALFSILGVTYGGNGTQTFGLPNLMGRVAVGAGTGHSLSTYQLGQVGGSETCTLTTNEMPVHNHVLVPSLSSTLHPVCSTATTGNSDEPDGKVPAATTTDVYTSTSDDAMKTVALTNFAGGVTASVAGGSQPHTNLMPVLGMNYIICMYGVFPYRN